MSKAVVGFKIVMVIVPRIGLVTFTEGKHSIPPRRRHRIMTRSVDEWVEEVREFLRINAQTPNLDQFKDGGMDAVIAHVVGNDPDLQAKVKEGMIEHACRR